MGFHASTCSSVQIPGVFGYLSVAHLIMVIVIWASNMEKFITITWLIITTVTNKMFPYPWAESETPVASAMRKPPGLVLWE
jgi:hypothetical protein